MGSGVNHVITMRPSSRVALRLTWANVAVSCALAVPLIAVALGFGTRLGLAQGADSVADAITALALLYSLRVASRPADQDHPLGHQRAEPLGALFAAMMAGALSLQVMRSAIDAITTGELPDLRWPVAVVFALKLAARLSLSMLAGRGLRTHRSPALRALQVDARNDALVSGLALVGFFAARYGWAGLDPWLAIPVAAWIACAGITLARENISLLMGEAAPDDRHGELHALAAHVPGVRSVHGLTARHDGTWLEVTLAIVVDETLSVRQAHDVAEAVRRRLTDQGDIVRASVHVDVDPPSDHAREG